jgi:hypothetical protein
VAIAEVHNLNSEAPVSDPARQAEILGSMAEHGWWRHRTGRESPAVLVPRFTNADPNDLDVNSTIGIDPLSQAHPKVYYGVMGRVLGLGGRHTVVRDLYVMRAVSVGFALATLWIAWLGAQIAGGDFGGVVAVLLALHPQFAVVSTTASPDALVNLAGACVWWQAMCALRGPRIVWPIAGVWAAAAAGATVDRIGIPLLAIALLISVAAVRRLRGLGWRTWATTVAGTAALVGMLWLLHEQIGTFSATDWRTIAPVEKARTAEFFTSFAAMLFRTWWFTAGWIRYYPGVWWTAGVLAITVIAGAGLARLVSRSDPYISRTVVAHAALMLIVQLSAVYWTHFRFGTGPQGRYLFPCVVPAIVLLLLGVETWVPAHYRLRAAAALVLVFAVLDMTAWLTIAMPAYAR